MLYPYPKSLCPLNNWNPRSTLNLCLISSNLVKLHHHYCNSFRLFNIALYAPTGNAFPIPRHAKARFSGNSNQSGKSWNLARARGVIATTLPSTKVRVSILSLAQITPSLLPLLSRQSQGLRNRQIRPTLLSPYNPIAICWDCFSTSLRYFTPCCQ